MSDDYKALKAAINEEMAALKEKMSVLGKEYLKTATKDLFDKNPTLNGFAWAQYTPYFNDGDPCHFGVWADEPEILINDTWFRPDYQKAPEGVDEDWAREISDQVAEIIFAIDEDVLEELFGDHVKVIMTRDDVEAEYYEHD